MRPTAFTVVKTAVLSAVLAAVIPATILAAESIPKQGTTRYVTHFVFRPLSSVEIPGVGQVTAVEAVGPTENMDGQQMLDKMKAKCSAVKVDAGDKKYINGACALTDNDGHVVFSTFDTRDLDKSQPQMDCGTHIIIGGTGKFTGISGREPFACISKPTPQGEPVGSFAIDIPHNTTWEIKTQG